MTVPVVTYGLKTCPLKDQKDVMWCKIEASGKRHETSCWTKITKI